MNADFKTVFTTRIDELAREALRLEARGDFAGAAAANMEIQAIDFILDPELAGPPAWKCEIGVS